MKRTLFFLAAGMAALPAFAQRADTEAIPDLPLLGWIGMLLIVASGVVSLRLGPVYSQAKNEK